MTDTPTPITALSADELKNFMSEKFPDLVEKKLVETEAPKPRKICIALLAYDGRMEVRMSSSLMQSAMALAHAGFAITIIHRDGDSMVARGRSFLASQFLENDGLKDCTDLIMIDVDLAWSDPNVLVRLCSHPVDVVAAAYPYKDDQGNFPLRWPSTGLMEENGLWEVQAVTPGFLRISRNMLEKVAREMPWLRFADRGTGEGKKCWMFFDNLARPTGVFDEGYVFCEHVKALGGKIWLDPDIDLTHIGKKAYNFGTIRQWLEKKAETFTQLEHEFPHIPPLKLMGKAMEMGLNEKPDIKSIAEELEKEDKSGSSVTIPYATSGEAA